MNRAQLYQFGAGMRLLASGLRRYLRSPRLIALGLLPALLSLLLFTALLGLLLWNIDDLTSGSTWFADDWSAGWRATVRVFAGVAIVAVAGLLMMLTYTAITLAIGDPFYEMIAESVEQEWGGVPDEVDVPWYRSIARSIIDSLRMLLLSALILIPLAPLGLIPVVGQVVVPVVGAIVGGWFLALEMVGVAFARRGLRLADRRRLLREHRPLALGFGVAVFVCFLIPLGAVLIMPAAVIGGTLLARRVLGLPTSH